LFVSYLAEWPASRHSILPLTEGGGITLPFPYVNLQITGTRLMSNETLVILAVAWLAIGLVGFRWASVVAARENAWFGEDNERILEESSLRQAALTRELNATHAELAALRTECSSLKGKLHGAME
jgi:hypothetical protein